MMNMRRQNISYRELCGVCSYPASCSKLEMCYTISVCGRHRGKWGRRQYDVLKKVFECGHTTRAIGLIYSKGLCDHGLNTLYCYADSAHSIPRSQGCTLVLMNGAAISCISKKHTTTASSTCHDKLIEFWIAGSKTAGFRNILSEKRVCILKPQPKFTKIMMPLSRLS